MPRSITGAAIVTTTASPVTQLTSLCTDSTYAAFQGNGVASLHEDLCSSCCLGHDSLCAFGVYQTRKADAIAGRKKPNLRNTRGVTIGDLLDDVLEHVAHHKDIRNYNSRAEIVREGLGTEAAADLLPTDLRRWLDKQCKSAATFNRYKSLISLAYKVGAQNNKVLVNSARMVMHRKEPVGRIRYRRSSP